MSNIVSLQKRERPWRGYAVAVAAVTAAFAVCLAVAAMVNTRPPAMVLLIPIAISAYLGGLGPGLASTLLGSFAAFYFLAPPLRDSAASRSMVYERLATMAAVGLLVSVLSEVLRRDIIRRKLVEKTLAESEQRYRLLFENMLDGFAYCKMLFDDRGHPIDFVYLHVNSAFGRLTGLRDVEGKKVTHVIPGIRESHPELFETYGRVASTGQPERFEIAFQPLKSWFSVSVYSPRKDHIVIMFDNITKRRLAEEALRSQLQLMNCITDKTTDSIFVVDVAGCVTFLNPEAERVFGFTAAEMKGQVLHEMIHHHRPDGSPYPAGDCPMAKGLDSGETVRDHEDIFFRKDGTLIEVSCSNALLEASGQRIGTVHVLHDITERKRAARSKLRSQKLEALGTVAAGIAHDFNNILAAINGNANLAVSDLSPGDPVRECLSEISKAGARASDLVRRILSFTQPVEQKRQVQPLQPVVEEGLKLVRATLSALIDIHTDCAPDLPLVSVDSTQIHQVIVNLTTNAAHAIGDRHGRIEVRLDARWIDSESISPSSKMREGRYVRLYVGDDGCGMDAATLDRIFDPFFTTKPTGQGTGLGLSVVHGIVASHDGHIAAYSEPGKGAAFHLYFPAAEGAAEIASLPQKEAPRGRTERVLYVDDEEALVSLAQRRLGRLGYTLAGFTRPEEALQEFRRRPADFDIVVTDVSMPGMSGFELARGLLAVRPDIPVVVTSGYFQPQDEAKARQLGIVDLLPKPATIDDLARTLDRILRERAGNPGPAPATSASVRENACWSSS